MKLYHGSPKLLDILKPILAKGLTKFENQNAVFLVSNFDNAALYAIGKTLKGKTIFAIHNNELIIVGNLKLKSGYVYETNVKAKKGEREQYAYNKDIDNFKVFKVFPKNYFKNIIRVKNKLELMKKLGLAI